MALKTFVVQSQAGTRRAVPEGELAFWARKGYSRIGEAAAAPIESELEVEAEVGPFARSEEPEED